jgi:hypothetical protein
VTLTSNAVIHENDSFPTILVVAIISLLLVIYAVCGLVLIQFVVQRIGCNASKRNRNVYEPILYFPPPEMAEVSSFLSNPDVPLIPLGDIEVGRSIGKGATGVVRTGIWHSQ